MRAVTVDDPALKMVAFTANIPKSWKFTGMIAYPGGCHPPQVPADGLTYTALAPDGITALEKLPGASWIWNSDGSTISKCKPVKVDNAASFLLNIAVPNLRPDANDVRVVPLPAKMQQSIDEDNKQQPQSGVMGRRTVDAARVHVAYTYKDHPVEEMLFAIVSCQEFDFPAYPALHRPANQRHLCRASGVNIRRAPKGALEALTNSILPPPQINPQWDAADAGPQFIEPSGVRQSHHGTAYRNLRSIHAQLDQFRRSKRRAEWRSDVRSEWLGRPSPPELDRVDPDELMADSVCPVHRVPISASAAATALRICLRPANSASAASGRPTASTVAIP